MPGIGDEEFLQALARKASALPRTGADLELFKTTLTILGLEFHEEPGHWVEVEIPALGTDHSYTATFKFKDGKFMDCWI